MNKYQRKLFNQAKDYWDNGHTIPLDLFASMASEGMDVPRLEQKYLKQE